jgi:hypothetical protein
MTKSRGIRPARLAWSEEQLAMLRERYPNERTSAIATAIGRPIKSVYSKAQSLGMKKSVEFLASPEACRLRRGDSIGAEYRFKPGQTPSNKGLRRPGWAPGRMAETQFKPGHRGGKAAALYQPIGTERISKDGYRERKINDDMPLQRRWRAVHILTWEAVHGPLPQGHALVFRDGDKTNVAIGNLELISRADLMRRNTRHNLPKELSDLIQLRGALNRAINHRTKNEQ